MLKADGRISIPVIATVDKPFRNFVNSMDALLDRLFEKVDKCNRQNLEEFIDMMLCDSLPVESFIMLVISTKVSNTNFTSKWLVDLLFNILHRRYTTRYNENGNGDDELDELESMTRRDVFCNFGRRGVYMYDFYKKHVHENEKQHTVDNVPSLGFIVEAVNGDDVDNTISQLGVPMHLRDKRHCKFLNVDINMRPVDGNDDGEFVQENQRLMREIQATISYSNLRRRLAWKRWALVREEFCKLAIAGPIVAFWAHETNKPESKAFKRARTRFYSPYD